MQRLLEAVILIVECLVTVNGEMRMMRKEVVLAISKHFNNFSQSVIRIRDLSKVKHNCQTLEPSILSELLNDWSTECFID